VSHTCVQNFSISLNGVRLWDGLEAIDDDYPIEATSSPSGVIHLTFLRSSEARDYLVTSR
jgi:hypothetical protein